MTTQLLSERDLQRLRQMADKIGAESYPRCEGIPYTMRRDLVRLGVVYAFGDGCYALTAFGRWVLAVADGREAALPLSADGA